MVADETANAALVAEVLRQVRGAVAPWLAHAAPRSAANLLGWLHEPYVKDKVVAVLKSAEHPLLMCEVAEACGFPVSCANRVLLRLHQRGQAARYKLPIQRHAYCRKTKACIPNGARRQLYVYSWMGTGH